MILAWNPGIGFRVEEFRGGQGWRSQRIVLWMLAWNSTCVIFVRHCQRRTGDGLLHSKLGSLVAAGSRMLRKCWGFRAGRCDVVSTNCINCQVIRLPVGFGDQGLVEKKITPDSDVARNLHSLLETRTAGDPDNEQIVFTDLSPAVLSVELCEMGTPGATPRFGVSVHDK